MLIIRRRNTSWFDRAGHHGIFMPFSPEYGLTVCLSVYTGLEPGVTDMGITSLAEIKTPPLILRFPVDNEYSRTHKHTTNNKSGVKCFV